jgi:hypothetical protein
MPEGKIATNFLYKVIIQIIVPYTTGTARMDWNGLKVILYTDICLRNVNFVWKLNCSL